MRLFQKSVVRKYLQGLDFEEVNAAWDKYSAHFHNPTIQDHIRNSKEEEYQEGFVRDLFVTVLGYTLKPQPDYDFVLEKKTEADATKSDGALLRSSNVIGVVELKDTSTTDLDSIEKQVFGYKSKHKNCNYIITSNFEKLRFYISDAIDHEDFDLFNLKRDDFTFLYLCLSQKSIEADTPLKMKQTSITEEKNITKKLYDDYSQFKNSLFNNIAELNPTHDRLELFKKTQKLLDRLLFILFAEDRLLVPPNSVREILDQWEKLKELDNYVPLYDRFKKYFGYLNTGHEGKQYDIFGYNGGLFAEDVVLDDIKIDDNLLYNGAKTLSNYDYESEVDVNILGHIFEHSLSEIEEVQAELQGITLDKGKTKRKKEGIFYTPRYITKYIVENTVGELCRKKRNELGINSEIFAYRKRKDARENKIKILNKYRDWLFQLTICDPACGSGAFLNQALEFLIAEHKLVDELTAQLLGEAIVMSDVEKTILQNNLYGVDINEDAIEIARLSLWLRTAQKGRKLNDLSQHIRCGNSLIDDASVAGEKAFNWVKQFPEIFEKGGFDVIIGNPPYVDVKNLPNHTSKYLFSKYSTSENRINLYSIFIERGVELLRPSGFLSFINPNSMLVNSSYKKLRELLISPLTQIIKLPDDVFPDAKVETMIFVLRKGISCEEVSILPYAKDEKITSIDPERFFIKNKEDWRKDESLNFNLYLSDDASDIISRVEKGSVLLGDYCDFSLGITPYDKYKGHSPTDIENRVFHSTTKRDDAYKPLISGENIIRYYTLPHIDEFIKYGEWLGRPREERFFNEERIIARQIVSGTPPRIYASYANEPYYFTHHGFGLIPRKPISVKYLLVLLNSRLINYYHTYKYLDIEKRLFQKFLIENCKKLPIKIIDQPKQLPFIEKAEIMIAKGREVNEAKSSFNDLLTAKFDGLKITNKLYSWYDSSFNDFIKELKKQKIKISIAEEADWLKYFEEQKRVVNDIQKAIDNTDREIDRLVYSLYDLTEEEIEMIETSNLN